MPQKNLNLAPFNFKYIVKWIKAHWKLIVLIIIIFLIFFTVWLVSKKATSNKELLKVLEGKIQGVMLSKHCVTLDCKDKNLIYELVALLDDSKYYFGNKVANIHFLNLPSFLDELTTKEEILIKKEIFIKAILPLIINANNEVLADRHKVLYLSGRMPKEELSEKDMETFRYLANKYNLKQKVNTPWDVLSGINMLVVIVNPIPNSLVLAMAIKEAGWGKSRFLKEGNSLFSEWTFNYTHEGIEPLQKRKNMNYAVRKYKTLADSVRSYFFNINCSDHYKAFRELRFKQLTSIRGINVYKLTDTLEKYAENPNYAAGLREIITHNKLTNYDKYTDIVSTKKPICLYFQ